MSRAKLSAGGASAVLEDSASGINSGRLVLPANGEAASGTPAQGQEASCRGPSKPSDAQAALDSSIALFCAATCSQINVSKFRGFLVQAQPLASASVAALPSISFITGQQTIKHLEVLLSFDMQAASYQQFHRRVSCHQRQGQALGSSEPVISGQGACGQASPSCLCLKTSD